MITRTVIKEGWVKLTSPNGVKDTRNGETYSEVVCKDTDEKWFVEGE